MNGLGDLIGELCKAAFPIPEESYAGNPDSAVAICTLSSIGLLRQIANSPEILDRVAVAGRLFSENKGIDSLVRHVNSHKKIRTIIVCGKEVPGHRAGHSLMALHKNGIGDGHNNNNKRIIGSSSPEPYLTVTKHEVAYFQNEVALVDRIGSTDLGLIKKLVQ